VRPIAEVQYDSDLRLTPASSVHQSEILQGIQVSGEEAFQAMPWLEAHNPIPIQVSEYLNDVSNFGAGGLSYHWAIVFQEQFVGLIALDYTPNLTLGHWNLGYWILTPMQRQGIASRAIDLVLDWIGRGGLTSIEIHVNPQNIAGVHTAESTVRRWNGHRMQDQVMVEVSGELIAHQCWLIPRLPLEASE
jgi:RimJ/RimL family protein N-acetyltransferase